MSGDGIDQDDNVAFGASQGFEAPAGYRSDQVVVREEMLRRVCRLSNSPGILRTSKRDNREDGSHEAPVYPDFCGNIFLMAGTPSRCTKKARTFSFTYEAWKKT